MIDYSTYTDEELRQALVENQKAGHADRKKLPGCLRTVILLNVEIRSRVDARLAALASHPMIKGEARE